MPEPHTRLRCVAGTPNPHRSATADQYRRRMPSSALTTWTGDRSQRLDRLEKAHASVRPTGPGRKWETDELNQAILLRLAAEYQGFCRDLHDECLNALAAAGTTTTPLALRVLRLAATANRALDRGNAAQATSEATSPGSA